MNINIHLCPKYALLLQDTYGRHLLDFSCRADCRTVGLEPPTNNTFVSQEIPSPSNMEQRYRNTNEQESAVESGTGARMPEAHSCASRAAHVWRRTSGWHFCHCESQLNAPHNSSAKHVSSDGDCGQQQSSLSPLCHSVPEKLVITKYHLFITTYFSVFKSVVLGICQ